MFGPDFIDADLSNANGGRPVSADGYVSGAAKMLLAKALGAARAQLVTRLDSGQVVSGGDLLKRFDSAVDAFNVKTLTSQGVFRSDSVGAEGGGLFASQLRQVQEKVLMEARPVPNAMRLFSPLSDIQLGIRSVAVRRRYQSGDARVHRSGMQIPTVSFAQAEMEFQIRHYVTSAVWDVFEEMSDNVVNFSRASELAQIARDVLEAFTNEMTWFGDDSLKIFGVLNYPWLDKEISALSWGGTVTDTKEHLTALNGWMNRQHHASKGTMGPNRIATSPRIADWISQTPMSQSGSLRDRTLGEVFTSGNGRLKGKIEAVHELENVLGTGIDAMLFYNDGPQGVQNILPGGGIRTLPLHQTDIERRQIFFIPHGGVRMLDVGNNLLVFVRWNG